MTIFQGLFDKDISDDKILDALSAVFGISRKQIFLTYDIYQIKIELDDVELLCEKAIARGNFRHTITLYLRSNNLRQVGYREQNIFSQLCNWFNCGCLISDNSPNPDTMILIKNNAIKNVSLIPEDSDNEIYNIVGH